jgi:DNA mismatch repair protein MutS2
MQVFPATSAQSLEFHLVCSQIEGYCRTPDSRAAARGMKTIAHHERLFASLNQTEEFRNILFNKLPFPDTEFQPLGAEAVLLGVQGSVLSEQQFMNIRDLIKRAHEIYMYLNEHQALYPYLSAMWKDTFPDPVIIKLIDEVIEEREAWVRSSASRELAAIRQELSHARRESEKRFRSFLAEMKKLGWVREQEETFYNGRRVISVVAEHKRDIKGVVHGSSETGKTAFIEPFATVEINNTIMQLQTEEKREVHRLLRELSNDLRPYHSSIKGAHEVMNLIDFTRAKAKYAISIDARLPEIVKEPLIDLREAVHPVLLLQNKQAKKATIPFSFSLSTETRMLIISGPNAGGKSITLKTAGLLQLMLQSGIPVPVKEGSRMSFFHSLMTDIGDSQSIEYELSTYSSRLLKARHFLQFANKRTLVLIDELGTGSDPDLGGALAAVLVEELHRLKTFAVITTHYANIKVLAEKEQGMVNASMEFDAETLLPKYKLSLGKPGSSYTFEVARKSGFPEALIERAAKKVDKGKLNMDRILLELQKDRALLEQRQLMLNDLERDAASSIKRFDELSQKLDRRQQLERERADETARLNELGRKMQQLIDDWNTNGNKKNVSERLFRYLTSEKRKKMEQQAAEKQEKRARRKAAQAALSITEGVKVRLMNSRQTGMVEEVNKGKAKVLFNGIRSLVSLEHLVAVPDKKVE